MRTPATVDECSTGGGGGTGNLSGQAFQYVATGIEGDTFTVNLPTPQADTNYIVQVSGGGMAAFLGLDTDTYAVDSFRLKCSAPPTAGDKINILIIERTA